MRTQLHAAPAHAAAMPGLCCSGPLPSSVARAGTHQNMPSGPQSDLFSVRCEAGVDGCKGSTSGRVPCPARRRQGALSRRGGAAVLSIVADCAAPLPSCRHRLKAIHHSKRAGERQPPARPNCCTNSVAPAGVLPTAAGASAINGGKAPAPASPCSPVGSGGRVRCSQARPAPGMTRGTMALAALLALLLAGELARPRRRRQPPPASAVAVHCSWTSPCCLCTCCMPVETSPRLLWADVVRFHGNVGWRATCRHRCRRR